MAGDINGMSRLTVDRRPAARAADRQLLMASTSDLSNNLNALALSEQIDPWSRPVDDNDPEDLPVTVHPPKTASNSLNPDNTPPLPDAPPPLPPQSPPFASSGPKIQVDHAVLDEFDPLGNNVEQEAKLAWEHSEPHPPVLPQKSSMVQSSEPPTQDKPTPLPLPAPIPVPDPVPIPPITDKPLPDLTPTVSTTQDPRQSIPRSTTPSLSGLAAIARNFIPKSPARTSRPLSIDQASAIFSPTLTTFGASTQEQGTTHKRSQSLGPALSPLNQSTRDDSQSQTSGSAPRTPKSAAKDVDKDYPPPFDFQLFLEQIKLKSAESVAKYLRSWVLTIIEPSLNDQSSNHRFLTNFAKRPFTVNDQVKLIHDFLNASPKSLRFQISF